MKTTDNNEMDLLLRALARNNSVFQTGSAGSQAERNIGAHLDADELNCYAEGVVTDVERAHYVKHLADCESCRHQIANLVPVASVMRREPVEQKTAWSFREKLAMLLSPAALRYALPALVLTSVFAIAIVALRQQKQTDFVARNETAPTPDLSAHSQPENVTTTDRPQTTIQPAEQTQSPANPKEKNPAGTPGQDNQPVAVPALEAGQSKEDLRTNKSAEAQTKPTLAQPAEAAAPPPPPRVASDDLKKMAESRKQEEDVDNEKRRREDTNVQMRDANEADRVSGPRKGPSRGSGAQNIGGLSSTISRDKEQKAAGRVAESRTVSGRVFYHQGNAWVDADYASGRATVSMKRGSEQFRALIADEPGLRSIADQLAGEVFVVWKGAAYRIH